MSSDKFQSDSLAKPDILEIIRCTEAVKKAGFGEVRVVIRNGAVYRIQTTEDKLVTKD